MRGIPLDSVNVLLTNLDSEDTEQSVVKMIKNLGVKIASLDWKDSER